MTPHQRILNAVDELVELGQDALGSCSGNYAPVSKFTQFKIGCLHILDTIGQSGEQFRPPFVGEFDEPNTRTCEAMFGSILALQFAIRKNLLVTVKELVLAETFSDLIEQAEELAGKTYFLAAGVICRAVFEEHLRNLCEFHECMPEGKTTIEPLKQELVKAKVFDKLAAKQVDAIAGAGNQCAHNLSPALTGPEILNLIQNVKTFLAVHPLH